MITPEMIDKVSYASIATPRNVLLCVSRLNEANNETLAVICTLFNNGFDWKSAYQVINELYEVFGITRVMPVAKQGNNQTIAPYQ